MHAQDRHRSQKSGLHLAAQRTPAGSGLLQEALTGEAAAEAPLLWRQPQGVAAQAAVPLCPLQSQGCPPPPAACALPAGPTTSRPRSVSFHSRAQQVYAVAEAVAVASARLGPLET